ncbi:MAG: ABC transporter permease, partial [Aminobacteriaceae bacterium]
MLKYIVKRIFSLIPVMLGVAFIVFTLLYLTPGDPARIVLGEQATAEAIQEFREKEGLNDPFLVQFGNYVWKAVTKGDIGRSYMTRRSVANEIMNAFPSTLKLALCCVVVAVILGIPIGILSAIRQNSFFDNITRFLAILGLSMPVFW